MSGNGINSKKRSQRSPFGDLRSCLDGHKLSRARYIGTVKHGKNGFVTATKLGTTNKFFVTATKNFAAATKRFVDRTKHFVAVTKHFCYPYFNKRFCWYNKNFYTVRNHSIHQFYH